MFYHGLTVLGCQVEIVVFKIQVVDNAVFKGHVVVEMGVVDYCVPDKSEWHVGSDSRN